MRRPLIIVALCYVCGLLLAAWTAVPLGALLMVGAGLAGTAFVWARGRPWILPVLVVVTGWANLAAHTQIISPEDLRLSLGSEPEDAQVRGRLVEMPSVRMFLRDEEESFRTLLRLEVTHLRRGGQWLAAHGKIITVTPGDLGFLHAGDCVEVRGILSPPAVPVAPGLFDYRQYLAHQGIWYQLRASSTNDWHRAEASPPPLAVRFLDWAQATLARGLPVEDEALRLLWGMTLGWRTGLTNEIYTPFMQSGTMHIFAISGLHIALIAGILVALLRGLRLPRHWCGVVVIPLIWFYTAATGWQPSAIRSVIMMTIIIGGWSLGRPSDLLNSLAAAGLVILVWDPQQLFQASFQLSFFVVLSIALLLPALEQVRDRLLAHDPLLPAEALPRWKRWLHPPLRFVASSAATSLAAWLGALPLTMYYFHLFSPVTLLANLVVVPLSSLALASNLASLLCGAWWPGLAELFNHGAWFWMKAMMHVSELATRLPGAFAYVRPPGAADFVIYYGVLLGLLAGGLKPGRRRWLAAAALAAGVFYGWRALDAQSVTRLTVLPLQGGSAVFVDGADAAERLLVDCGNTNAANFVTTPFLRGQGVNHLPRLALTHGDLRYVGGAAQVAAQFDVREWVTSPVRFRSRTYRELMEQADAAGRLREVAPRDAVAGWTVLHPDAADKFPQADDNALVLRREIHGTRVLLLADLGMLGQDALASRDTNLLADIVVTGLPEKSAPLTEHFLAAVRPRLIVVADSEFPATRRAPAALLERLALTTTNVIATRQSGAVQFEFRPGQWTARTMDGREWRGAAQR